VQHYSCLKRWGYRLASPEENSFLKKYGIDDKTLTKTMPKPAPSLPDTTAAKTGGGGIMGTITGGIEKAHEFAGGLDPLDPKEIGRGEAKAAGGLALGAAKLAGRAFPSINEALGNSPTAQQLQQFVNRPSEGFAETAGNVATQGAAMLMGPGGARAAGYIPKAYKYTRAAVEGVEAAAKGALGGAVANPDDPATGAAWGAGGSIAGPAFGMGLRSRGGRWLGGHLPGSLAGYSLYNLLGHHDVVGSALAATGAHAVRWVNTPFGNKLYRFGSRLFDQTGRLVGSLTTREDWSGAMAKARQFPGSVARPMPQVGEYAGAVTPQLGGYATESARQNIAGDQPTQEYRLPSIPWTPGMEQEQKSSAPPPLEPPVED
jgi:hypothetical protein